MGKKVGEVIESSTVEFVAQSYELHDAPAFGSLVRVGNGSLDVYGLVYNVTTSSLDPGRRPIARGKEEEDQTAIFRNNPQLEKLFRTDFTCLIAGFAETGKVFHFLPPAPPRVHSFVHQCGSDEVLAFAENLEFLPLLFSCNQIGPIDELVAAFLRLAGKAGDGGSEFLVRAGKGLAVLLAGDLRRLNAILRRIRP